VVLFVLRDPRPGFFLTHAFGRYLTRKCRVCHGFWPLLAAVLLTVTCTDIKTITVHKMQQCAASSTKPRFQNAHLYTHTYTVSHTHTHTHTHAHTHAHTHTGTQLTCATSSYLPPSPTARTPLWTTDCAGSRAPPLSSLSPPAQEAQILCVCVRVCVCACVHVRVRVCVCVWVRQAERGVHVLLHNTLHKFV
jgi:hypothetical protein